MTRVTTPEEFVAERFAFDAEVMAAIARACVEYAEQESKNLYGPEPFSGLEEYYHRLFQQIKARHRPAGTGGDTDCLISMVEWLWKLHTRPPKCDGNHGGPRCADPECWNQ